MLRSSKRKIRRSKRLKLRMQGGARVIRPLKGKRGRENNSLRLSRSCRGLGRILRALRRMIRSLELKLTSWNFKSEKVMSRLKSLTGKLATLKRKLTS